MGTAPLSWEEFQRDLAPQTMEKSSSRCETPGLHWRLRFSQSSVSTTCWTPAIHVRLQVDTIVACPPPRLNTNPISTNDARFQGSTPTTIPVRSWSMTTIPACALGFCGLPTGRPLPHRVRYFEEKMIVPPSVRSMVAGCSSRMRTSSRSPIGLR